MKNYTIDTTVFVPEYVDALEKILTRLGVDARTGQRPNHHQRAL